MNNTSGYKDLIAWQKCNKLAHAIYDVSEQFPKNELFGMTSQMRRAVLSVCANIAEGYSRSSTKDRLHFYVIAQGSLTELEFFEDFAYERKYIKDYDYQIINTIHKEAAKVLYGLARSSRFKTLATKH